MPDMWTLFGVSALVASIEVDAGQLFAEVTIPPRAGGFPLAAALVPLAGHSHGESERFCVVTAAGIECDPPDTYPAGSWVRLGLDPQQPLPNPLALPPLTFPAGARLAQLIVLLRSPTDPVATVPQSRNTDSMFAQRIEKGLASGGGPPGVELPDATEASDDEIQTAIRRYLLDHAPRNREALIEL